MFIWQVECAWVSVELNQIYAHAIYRPSLILFLDESAFLWMFYGFYAHGIIQKL